VKYGDFQEMKVVSWLGWIIKISYIFLSFYLKGKTYSKRNTKSVKFSKYF